jgi:hypothetical protein
METTRRFHRSTLEAFKDADYACALERPRSNPAQFFVYVTCAIGVLFVVGLLLSEVI